jgi:uncharacterized protein
VSWYREAAEQGYAPAQYKLGFMNENGQGAPLSLEAAAIWYRKAAEQGYAFGQYARGVLYEKGLSVPQDRANRAIAISLFRRAAEQGCQLANAIRRDGDIND